jgi:hypothetical protein
MLKLYLKAFLSYAVIFGVLMTLWEYYDTGNIIIRKQVLQAVLFGAVMSYANIKAIRRARSIGEKEDIENKNQ